ncbi:hypothetical protein [Sphingomonas sp. RB1R13]|uniref:hypothetical protein n=1 Tax=Sphingomonas sp. RB1R13 TaxID=3096159 RepID=UPI002FC84EF7
MAVHIHTQQASRAIGTHLPLNVALAILPSLPRPYLAHLVANAIDLMDEQDGDEDREPEVTEQDDEPEIDDEPELDDHGGGNVEDEGEPESGEVHPAYGIDQSTGPLSLNAN